jgi:hypothetical protein
MKYEKSLENRFTQSARNQTDCVHTADIASLDLTICAQVHFNPVVFDRTRGSVFDNA